MMREYYYSIASSIVLHALILLLACIVIVPWQIPQMGTPDVPMIQTYLYQEAQVEKKPALEKTIKTIERTPLVKKTTIALTRVLSQQQQQKSIIKTTQHSKQQTQQVAIHQKSNGKPPEELVTLLHAAIQEHQHYPLSAQQMEREGTVSVQFTLLVDGHIKALSLLKSSGTASLDEAALQAVAAAVPFAKVHEYLQKEKSFSIDVVFQLS